MLSLLKKISRTLALTTLVVLSTFAPSFSVSVITSASLNTSFISQNSTISFTYSQANAAGDEVFSPEQVKEDISDAARSALLQISGVLSIFLTAMNYLLWPLLMMIGALMDNSLILGGGMEDRLLLIWSQIRNIVNLGFVLVLVGIAIYNVLGIGEEGNYTIKKILPKIIIALIVVNFTFIGSKLALDAANVVTTAMFALPNSVEDSFNLTRVNEMERAICGQLDDLGATSGVSLGNTQSTMCADESTFTANARQFFQSLSSSNIAMVMAVNMGQIHKGVDVSNLVKMDPTVSNLGINMIISILMYVLYASAFAVLFLVLLARLVTLWLVIALSPLLAVKIAVPSLEETNQLQEDFITHLLAPIKIGFGMSVGYIMLDAYQATGGNSLGISLGQELSAPFSGIGSLQQLLIAAGALAVVWKVTFDAANKTHAKRFTNMIQDQLRKTGTSLAQIPLNLPILPFSEGEGGDGKSSLRQVMKRMNNSVTALGRGETGDNNRTTLPDAIRMAQNGNNFDREPALTLLQGLSSPDARRDLTVEGFNNLFRRMPSDLREDRAFIDLQSAIPSGTSGDTLLSNVSEVETQVRAAQARAEELQSDNQASN